MRREFSSDGLGSRFFIIQFNLFVKQYDHRISVIVFPFALNLFPSYVQLLSLAIFKSNVILDEKACSTIDMFTLFTAFFSQSVCLLVIGT